MSKKKLFVMLIVLAAFVPAQAVLTNGGFETGDLTGWFTWTEVGNEANQSVTVENYNVYAGSYAAEVWTASGKSTQLGQSVTMGPGVTMSVSLAYEGTFWGGAGLSMNCYDASWNWLSYAWAPLYNGDGTDTGWLLFDSDTLINSGWPAYVGSYEGSFVTPEGTANVTLRLDSWGWSTTYYDDVVLIPEPATMMLLSLGGLALVRRKRA